MMVAAAIATSTTRGMLSEKIVHDDRRVERTELRFIQWAIHLAQKGPHDQHLVRIESYAPYLAVPNSWLPVLEARIRDSIVPAEYVGEASTEWLTESIANAAISFFQAGADILPVEPYIYAAKSGDLVAEFETEQGNMTSVVSERETLLFAVLASKPNEPIHTIIRRGSNQFRDELKSFTSKLATGTHGKMDSK